MLLMFFIIEFLPAFIVDLACEDPNLEVASSLQTHYSIDEIHSIVLVHFTMESILQECFVPCRVSQGPLHGIEIRSEEVKHIPRCYLDLVHRSLIGLVDGFLEVNDCLILKALHRKQVLPEAHKL